MIDLQDLEAVEELLDYADDVATARDEDTVRHCERTPLD